MPLIGIFIRDTEITKKYDFAIFTTASLSSFYSVLSVPLWCVSCLFGLPERRRFLQLVHVDIDTQPRFICDAELPLFHREAGRRVFL